MKSLFDFQELRNIKAEHEAEIMAADERAARRWADQAERLRQAHEEEKIRIAETERQRAKEKIEKELSQFESDSQIQRDRLNQERAIEKERQHQHVEYLKETNQNQITALQGNILTWVFLITFFQLDTLIILNPSMQNGNSSLTTLLKKLALKLKSSAKNLSKKSKKIVWQQSRLIAKS